MGDRLHVTNWTRPRGDVRQFSLLNASGATSDYLGDSGDADAVRAKRLVHPELEAIARFAALFGPTLRNLRLNGIGESSGLSAHEERSIQPDRAGRRHIVRFHLLLFTNPSARIYLDGEQFRFAEGTLYFFNHGCVHAASNAPPSRDTISCWILS